jgi:hypothetical protein
MPKPRNGHFLTDKRLLISNLQKCIRRGLSEKAIRTGLCLLEYHPKQAIRRLPVIMVEDTILHPNTPKIIEMMIKESQGKHLNEEDVNIFLSIVRDLCEVTQKDLPDDHLIDQHSEIKPKNHLKPFGLDLTQALYARAKYGGMKFDMNMLKRFAKQWEMRFFLDEFQWFEFLANHYPERESVNYQTIRTLLESDILLESVDHHCSGIVTVLAKKRDIKFEIFQRFHENDPKPTIRDILWCLRSSTNPRQVFWDSSYQVDFYLRQDHLTQEKFRDIYQIMAEETDKISRWHINKLHKAANS